MAGENEEKQPAAGPDVVALLGGLSLSKKTADALNELDQSRSKGPGDEGGDKKDPPLGEKKDPPPADDKKDPPPSDKKDPPPGDDKKDPPPGDDKGDEGGDKGEEGGEKKPKEKEDIKANKLGLSIKEKASKKDTIEIESPEQAIEHINKSYGMQLKDIKDLPKFFDSVNKMRVNSQNFEKVQKEKDDILTTLQNLPEDLLEAVQLSVKGMDYNAAFANKPKFDFSKTADKYSEKELIEAYFPGKFTAEDFAEEAPGEIKKALDIAKSTSIEKYNSEKQSRETKRAGELERSKKSLQAFNDSLTSSVADLKSHFPGMAEDTVTEIQETLSSGAILGRFFNDDGTLKKDAASKLAMADYGRDILNDLMEAAKHVAETQVNEDLLDRGNNKPKPKKGTGVEKVSEGAKKDIAELGSLNHKKTF